jgi:signal transduction histidine kinase
MKDKRTSINSLISELTPALLSESKASVAIQKSLDLILERTDVCRIYLFDLREHGEHGYVASQRYESCRLGVKPEIGNPHLQDIPMRPHYNRWVEHFLQKKPIIGLTRNFPEGEKELLQEQQIKSLLVLPVISDGKPIAFAGFDNTLSERTWSGSHLRILKDTVELLGSLLIREKFEAQIETQQIEKEKLYNQVVTEQIKLRKLTDNINEGLWIRDGKTFELLFVNETVAKIFGVKNTNQFLDNKGEYYLNHVHQADREFVDKTNRRHAVTGEDITIEWRLLTSSREIRWVRTRLFTVNDQNDANRLLHCGVMTDVTEEQKRYDAIQEAKFQAEDLNRLKSNILQNIRHEFRTPITGIIGFAELIKQNSNSDEIYDFSNGITASANRLHSTLDSLIDFAALDVVRPRNNPEWISVKDTLSDLLDTLKYKSNRKGVELKLFTKSADRKIYLDGHNLYTIVRQIFDNAVKFTNKGTISVAIDVKSDLFSLSVADTGCGIKKEVKPFLFEPFRQGSEGISRLFDGNGIGLPIVKRYLELINGSVFIEDNHPAGTVVTIKIPLSLQYEHHETRLPEKSNSNNILYVEDNTMLQLMVREAFRDYSLDIAGTGAEAVSLLNSKTYGVFLLDINLGAGMNGIEICQSIRSRPEYKGTPVYAITASSRADLEQHIGEHGFTDVLSKPFNIRHLMDLVSMTVSQ